MKNILNRGFSEMGLNEFVAKVQAIIAALTGNPHFATTTPTLAQLTAALADLTSAMSNPNPAARQAGIDTARPKLEQLLDDLANNLETTAADDRPKLATTGFDLHKTPRNTAEAPAIPAALRLKTTGVTGEVQVLLEASERAKAYEVQVSLDSTTGWTTYDIFTSSRGIKLTGQPRAKDIWVRVRAIGPHNTKSGWSDPATILVA